MALPVLRRSHARRGGTGLLDKLRLLVHPVAARRGERLFDEGKRLYPLRLLRSDIFPTGVVRLVYAPDEIPRAQTSDDVTDQVSGADQGLTGLGPGGKPR